MSLVFTPEGTPASPQEGEVYYDSTADKLKVRDASAFREVVSKNSSDEIDGTFNGTIGSSARLPQGSITNVHCSTSDITPYTPLSNYSTVAGGSSVSYTPATGARFVIYQYTTTWDNDDNRSIVSFKLQLDSLDFARLIAGWDDGTSHGGAGSGTISMRVAIDLSTVTTDFPAHSSHNWQTNAGGTSAFSAGTLRVKVATHNTSYEATLCRLANTGDTGGASITRPTTLIYSVM